MPQPLLCNQALTRFILSPLSQKLYLAEPETMEDKVNYVYINGFVDVGDLPCRTRFWHECANRQQTLCPDIAWAEPYVRMGETKVDSSYFWHRPHHVSRWAKTIVTTTQAGDYCFDLATCGGVKIWVNGMAAAEFYVYDRNRVQRKQISLPLVVGDNEIIIHSDDMAERDTYFYFELIYKGQQPLQQSYGNDDNAIEQHAAWLASITAIQQMMYIGDDLHLQTSTPYTHDTPLTLSLHANPNETSQSPAIEVTWPAHATKLSIAHYPGLQTGFVHIDMHSTLKQYHFTQAIALTVLSHEKHATSHDRETRFAEAQDFLAQHGHLRMGRVVAAFAQGICDETHIAIIEDTLRKISQREDCSDFLIIPLLWIYQQHHPQHLSESLWNRIESVITGYRYWIDEPGNDAMWFWSENHTFCFHTAQYLAGHLFYKEHFCNSARTGAEQYQLGKARLHLFFDHLEKTGFVEWNSIAYYPIDFIALLALCELSPDADIQQRATHATEQLVAMIAIHALNGRATGSMGRAYEKELLSGSANELSSFIHALWDHGDINQSVAALPQLLAGSYRPSPLLDRLAHWNSDEGFEVRYCQGHQQSAQLVSWKNQHALLSSCVNHQTGAHGHQQHITDLSFAGNAAAKVWVNHPGELVAGGAARPSYWAGNGILPRTNQYRNRALMLFDIPEGHAIPWIHAYVPQDAFDVVEHHERWLFFRSNAGYGAIHTSHPLQAVENGMRNEWRCMHPQVGVIVFAGSPTQDGGFENFKTQLMQTQMLFDGLQIHYDDPFAGILQLNWQGDFFTTQGAHIPQQWQVAPQFSLDSKPETYQSLQQFHQQ